MWQCAKVGHTLKAFKFLKHLQGQVVGSVGGGMGAVRAVGAVGAVGVVGGVWAHIGRL